MSCFTTIQSISSEDTFWADNINTCMHTYAGTHTNILKMKSSYAIFLSVPVFVS